VPTEKLYLSSIESAYEIDFDATVISVDENSVILDRTLFYPRGGGQEYDTGYIEGESDSSPVVEVKGQKDIQHFLKEDHGFKPGDTIRGNIDWKRRYAHMRMHTAQHLVSALVYEMYGGARTVGNQIHHNKSRIDFNPIQLDDEKFSEIKNSFEEVVLQKLPITTSTMTREEINKIMPPERTNMNLLPKFIQDLRVVKIGENLDLCPCAGTHVRNVEELGDFIPLSKKSKGKGTQRLSYTLSEL